jgi:hypothetical protein
VKPSRILIAAAAAALLFAGRPAAAETTEDEVKKLKAEVEALKSRLDETEVKQKDAVVAGDIPGSFRIPGTEISLRLYGFAELNWVHEFKGDSSDIDYASFAPYIPLDGSAQANRKNRDYLTARTTRLGVEAGTPTRFGVLGVKIEGDFNNEPRLGSTALYADPDGGDGSPGGIFTQQATSSYGFRVRQAYGQFGGLLAGMTWSTFMDVDNFPETVDYNGPIGNTFIRQPVLRYTYGTPSYGNFTAALENSSSYVLHPTTASGIAVSSLSRMPDVVARWDKGFGWGAMSLRGVTQELRIDNGEGEKATRRGYGVGASAFIKSIGRDYLILAVTYGDGIGRYLNYIEGAMYDDTTGKIEIERAVGVVAGYQIKVSDQLRFNLVYGMTRNFDNAYTDLVIANGFDSGRFAVNRTVQAAHVGFFYTPIKTVDIGLEGMWLYRKALNGDTGDGLRLNAAFKYYIN